MNIPVLAIAIASGHGLQAPGLDVRRGPPGVRCSVQWWPGAGPRKRPLNGKRWTKVTWIHHGYQKYPRNIPEISMGNLFLQETKQLLGGTFHHRDMATRKSWRSEMELSTDIHIGPCGMSSDYQYLCDPFYHWKSTKWDFRWYLDALDALDAARLDSSCFFAMLRSLSLLQRFTSAATSTARLLLAA